MVAELQTRNELKTRIKGDKQDKQVPFLRVTLCVDLLYKSTKYH